MRKHTTILGLIFLMMLIVSTSLMAQDDINVEVGFEMYKFVYSYGEYYGVEIQLGGGDLKNVRYARIGTPNHKYMWLKNTFGLQDMSFDDWGMSYEDFNSKFPEGKYTFDLFPRRYGSFEKNKTHDFPPVPVITYPTEGATIVPLNLTITWEPIIGSVRNLILEIEDVEEELPLALEIDLPPDSTSFTVPGGLLKPETQYKTSLWTQTQIALSGDDLKSVRIISFTTAAQ